MVLIIEKVFPIYNVGDFQKKKILASFLCGLGLEKIGFYIEIYV